MFGRTLRANSTFVMRTHTLLVKWITYEESARKNDESDNDQVQFSSHLVHHLIDLVHLFFVMFIVLKAAVAAPHVVLVGL